MAESFTSVAACSFPAAVTTRVMGPRRAATIWTATGTGGRGRRERAVTAAMASTNRAAPMRLGQLMRSRTGAGARAGEARISPGSAARSREVWVTGICEAI